MTKKPKKENTTKASSKNVPFWLDPKAPLAQDFELADAVNKIIFKNMHRTVFGISERLEKSGIFAHAFLSTDPSKVGELLGLINRDIDAVKDFFFRPPAPSRDPRVREVARNCKVALRSRLIFASVLSEGAVSSDADKKRHSQYLTLYAIFRKPKTNKCFLAILSTARDPAKNLAFSDVPSTTSSPTSPSSSTASAGR